MTSHGVADVGSEDDAAYVSLEEARQRYGLSPRGLRRLIRERGLKRYRNLLRGGQQYVRVADLESTLPGHGARESS